MKNLDYLLFGGSTDKEVYVVKDKCSSVRFDSCCDEISCSNIRYITIDEQKAKEYMDACREYISNLSHTSNANIIKNENDVIVYTTFDDARCCTMTITLERYFLDFAFSKF